MPLSINPLGLAELMMNEVLCFICVKSILTLPMMGPRTMTNAANDLICIIVKAKIFALPILGPA